MNSLSGKIVAIVLALFLLVYVGYQGLRYFYSPVKTETVQSYTVEDTVYSSGIIIRDEVPVDGGYSGIISYFYDDGARVVSGMPVAEVHSDRESVQNQQKIAQISREISRLENIEKNYSGIVDITSISASIEKEINNLISTCFGGDLRNAQAVYESLQDALNKKAIAIGDVPDFSEKISRLDAQKTSLEAHLQTDVSQIVSPAYGYFSSYCDSGSRLITSDLLESATIKRLEDLAETKYEQDSSRVGTVILGYNWYYAAIIDGEDVEKFYEGMVANLSFDSSAFVEIPGTVNKIITEEGNQKAAVIFSCDYMSREIARLRNPSAQIEAATFSGLKIPYKALRFEDGQQGVYVVENNTLTFKKVDIQYDGVGFFISRVDNFDQSLVGLYDDVVTEGVDLYDGKQVNS